LSWLALGALLRYFVSRASASLLLRGIPVYIYKRSFYIMSFLASTKTRKKKTSSIRHLKRCQILTHIQANL
ncbi:MAG: hypothetical protein ACKPKO_24010, partial [Candidatus Fonsibacter sp.]